MFYCVCSVAAVKLLPMLEITSAIFRFCICLFMRSLRTTFMKMLYKYSDCYFGYLVFSYSLEKFCRITPFDISFEIAVRANIVGRLLVG